MDKPFLILASLCAVSVVLIAVLLHDRQPLPAHIVPISEPQAAQVNKPVAPLAQPTQKRTGPDIFNQQPPYYAVRPTDEAELKAYFAAREKPRPEGQLLPEAYDAGQVDRDPGYYARIDPSRVYQTSNKISYDQLPPIQALAPIHQWGLVHLPARHKLTVKAAPGRPVTFYAPQNGTFENGKFSITVKADKDGLASQTFTMGAEMGTYFAHVHCPDCKGTIVFTVEVVPPEQLKDVPPDLAPTQSAIQAAEAVEAHR
ncbi:MAG: hypothetical protein ACREP2_09580 [Rhodanobacteraceae bacterium]